jgi:hypothetical protein
MIRLIVGSQLHDVEIKHMAKALNQRLTVKVNDTYLIQEGLFF